MSDMNNQNSSPNLIPYSLNVAVWILAIFAIGTLITDAAAICLWLICSFFLFAFLDPFLQRLNRKGISPLLSSIVLISFAMVFLAGVFFTVYHYVPSMMSLVKNYETAIMHLLDSATKEFHRLSDLFSSNAQNADSANNNADTGFHMPDLSEGLGNNLLHGLGAALSIFTFAIMCPILTFFLISDRITFSHVFAKMYGSPEQGAATWKKICDAVVAYFLGNLLIGIITWPIFSLLFYFFGVSSPLLLAALASILNLIPFVGSVLSGLIPVLDLLTRNQGVGPIVGLAAICVFIHFSIANFVTPKVLGSKLDLNATTSTISLIIWGEIWGGLGLLLAIPLTAVIKILLEQSSSPKLQWISSLMSDNPDNMVSQTYKQIFSSKDEKEKETP